MTDRKPDASHDELPEDLPVPSADAVRGGATLIDKSTPLLIKGSLSATATHKDEIDIYS